MKRILAFTLLGLLGFAIAQAPAPVERLVAQAKDEKKKDHPQFKGWKPLPPAKKAAFHAQAAREHGHRMKRHMMFQTLPTSFDCRAKGWAIGIGDQGSCGSCYLYSTVQNMTDALVRAGFGKPDGSFRLATQYGMDCHDFGGCDGGNGNEVVDWACKNGWPAEKWVDLQGQSHSDYASYEARSARCRLPSGARLWIKGGTWGYVTSDQSDRPPTVDEVKNALYNYGTLNVALDAGGQFGDGTGTINSLGSSIDHEVRCVAYDDNNDNGDGTKGAVLIANQWNTQWGNNGYRWLNYNQVKKLVSVFWVNAGPLPPPPAPIPPDPVPPVPPAPGAPAITSPLTVTVKLGAPFTYQITATNSPDTLGARHLPAELACDAKGLIIGTPKAPCVFSVFAVNDSGATSATVTLKSSAVPTAITLTADQVQQILDAQKAGDTEEPPIYKLPKGPKKPEAKRKKAG